MANTHTLSLLLFLLPVGCSSGWLGKGQSPGGEEADADVDADTDADADTAPPDPEAVDDDGDGYSEQQGDCDDTDPERAPHREERPDGIDNDCDGTVDERFEIAVVDASGDCGWTSALDTDSMGNVHLVYTQGDAGTLLYRQRTAATGQWSDDAETLERTAVAGEWLDVVVDGADRLQVVYTREGYDSAYGDTAQSVWFAYRDSDGTWSDNLRVDSYTQSFSADLGEYVSLAVDADNVPRFLYQDGDGIYHPLGLFYPVPVLRGYVDRSLAVLSVAVGLDTPYVAGSGYFTDLAVDTRTDTLHSAWYDDSTDFGEGSVQYFQPYDVFDGVLPEPVTDTPGHWISLALQADGTPCLAFQEPSQKDVRYACRLRPGDWQVETVESTGALGEGTRLAFSSTDEPYIVYYDESNGDLRLAHHDGSGWTTLMVDGADADVGRYPSLAIGADDRVHIAYYDTTDGQLRYAIGR